MVNILVLKLKNLAFKYNNQMKVLYAEYKQTCQQTSRKLRGNNNNNIIIIIIIITIQYSVKLQGFSVPLLVPRVQNRA